MKKGFLIFACAFAVCAIPQSALCITEQEIAVAAQTQQAKGSLQYIKDNISKYFPTQDVQYFTNIIKELEKIGPKLKSIIETQLETKTRTISEPKEKLTTMLLAIEGIMNQDQFLQRQGFDEYDDIVIDAYSIAYHIKKEAAMCVKESEKRLKESERLLQEKDRQLQEKTKLLQELNEQLDQGLQTYEALYKAVDKEMVNKDPELQQSLKWYLGAVKLVQKHKKDRQIPAHMKKLTQGL